MIFKDSFCDCCRRSLHTVRKASLIQSCRHIASEGWCLVGLLGKCSKGVQNGSCKNPGVECCIVSSSGMVGGFFLKETRVRQRIIKPIFSKFSHSHATPTFLAIFLHHCLYFSLKSTHFFFA